MYCKPLLLQDCIVKILVLPHAKMCPRSCSLPHLLQLSSRCCIEGEGRAAGHGGGKGDEDGKRRTAEDGETFAVCNGHARKVFEAKFDMYQRRRR